MQKIIENKGITIIALVISIIIMLILAGVSIGMIMGENGLFGQTKKAVKSYDTASEMETLSLSVLNYNITNNEEDKLGEKLSKKDVLNPNWHMIKDEENTYADGWYFVEQGNDLPNGSKAKNNWVINYETGEVKQLKEKYASIFPRGVKMNESVNFSLVLNLSETGDRTNKKGQNYTGYELTLYENGTLVESSYLNTKQWEEFKKNCISSRANSFFLGNCRNGDVNKGKYNDYGKMVLKNCRFYTRPLSAEEIKLNYDTRLAYDKNDD